MDLDYIETSIKEILHINVIDLEGEINSKGNYLYLSGLSPENLIETQLEFKLVLADKNFQGSGESLKSTLSSVLKDIAKAKLISELEITLSNAVIKKKDDLYMYELKLQVIAAIDFN